MNTIATTVAVTSTIASRNSSRREDEKCALIIRDFKSDSSSIQSKREYARCVDRLYPSELPYADVLFIKFAIVLCAISFFIGLLWRGHDFLERLVCSLMSLCFSIVFSSVIYFLWKGLEFVFRGG